MIRSYDGGLMCWLPGSMSRCLAGWLGSWVLVWLPKMLICLLEFVGGVAGRSGTVWVFKKCLAATLVRLFDEACGITFF